MRPPLNPAIHLIEKSFLRRSEWIRWVKPAYDKPADVERSQLYSITACSGAADCARSAALVEPIMIASGIEPRMNIITSW